MTSIREALNGRSHGEKKNHEERNRLGDLRRHPQPLIEAYEALREEVVEGLAERSQRSALALFAHGGMLAWMQAWLRVSPVEVPDVFSPEQEATATTLRQEKLPSLSTARAEVTVVLTGMVLESLVV